MKRVVEMCAVVLALSALAGCGESEEERAEEARRQVELTAELQRALVSKVLYSVDGDTKQASITMKTPTGTKQQSDIDVPLTAKGSGQPYLMFSFQPGDFVYLSAQNSQGYGSVTCRITTDSGEVISANTSSGAYAIATCEGNAP